MCDDRIYLMRVIDEEQAKVDRVQALAATWAKQGRHKDANDIREALMDDQTRACLAADNESRKEDRRLDWWGMR